MSSHLNALLIDELRERLAPAVHGGTKGITFASFVQEAFALAAPHASLVWSWHMDVMADELEELARAVHRGESRDLVLCVPPSSTKSLLASALFQPWVWTWWPACRVITATYELSLAREHSRRSLSVVRSEWYQGRWPCVLVKDTETEWENREGGARIVTATGAAVTGRHGHLHIYDDLIKEQKSRLGTARQIGRELDRGRSFVSTTMATRRASSSLGRVLIGQRLHRRDPPGWALEAGWRGVVLPARGRPSSPMRHPRDLRAEGEVLCPARATAEQIEELATQLGPRAAAAQLDQNPSDSDGAILRPEYLAHRYRELPHALRRAGQWLTSWDLAFKGKSTSDWTVGQVWVSDGARFFLVDQVRGRMAFGEAKRAIRDLAACYPWVSRHLIEDAANASAVEDDLKSELAGIVLEPHGGGCLVRTQLVEGLWASGSVLLPEGAVWMGGSDGFVAEHLAFEGSDADTDDQVSASSLALLHLRTRGMLPGWARVAAAARER